MNVLKFLSGKKAILTGIAGVCTGLVFCINGDVATGTQAILTGLGVIFLRTGMNKK